MKKSLKKLSILIILIIMTLSPLACFQNACFQSYDNNGGDIGGESGTQITLENFNRLQTDMSLEEVTHILGTVGRSLSASSTIGITIEIWMWRYQRGMDIRIISVTFQNNAMTTKTESGLR